jgi:hypothetical protein
MGKCLGDAGVGRIGSLGSDLRVAVAVVVVYERKRKTEEPQLAWREAE